MVVRSGMVFAEVFERTKQNMKRLSFRAVSPPREDFLENPRAPEPDGFGGVFRRNGERRGESGPSITDMRGFVRSKTGAARLLQSAWRLRSLSFRAKNEARAEI